MLLMQPPFFTNGRVSALKALVEQNVYAFQGSGYSCERGPDRETQREIRHSVTILFVLYISDLTKTRAKCLWITPWRTRSVQKVCKTNLTGASETTGSDRSVSPVLNVNTAAMRWPLGSGLADNLRELRGITVWFPVSIWYQPRFSGATERAVIQLAFCANSRLHEVARTSLVSPIG